MKVKDNFCSRIYGDEISLGSVIRLLNYSMSDIKSYDELTSVEKLCISKDEFNEIFEDGKNILTKDNIIDRIVNADVNTIENFMLNIGEWDVEKHLREFNTDNIGKLVVNANKDGYRVQLDVEYGRDEYLYGYVLNEDTYMIQGIIDTKEEFVSFLHLDKIADLILSDKEKRCIFNLYFNNY